MTLSPLTLTVQDACRSTGLGRTTIYALIAEGKLDACKAGARTLIRADSLERYIGGLRPATIGRCTRDRT